MTIPSGLGDKGYGLGVVVGDYDNDGDPDVYLNNYGPNVLYRNNGDGTFTDISQEAGIGAHAGWGMGIVCADYDNDGDTDIFIGNDVAENFMFKNNGRGYQSHYGDRLYFGLGKRRQIDRIEVSWIGGGRDVFKNIPANQLITLSEGEPHQSHPTL